MAELNPDDPIVELPMKVLCSVCKAVIREDVARWPQSHIDKMKNIPQWTGEVISHGYCEEHDPSKQKS